MHIFVSRELQVDPEDAWAALADLESHHEWMKDAVSVEIVSPGRRGVGTLMRVPTRVWFLTTEDMIEVIGWDEGRSIEIRHTGAVTGTGTLEISQAEENGTRMTWDEELHLPWWFGGRLGELVAKPILVSMWRGNLARFEARLRSP